MMIILYIAINPSSVMVLSCAASVPTVAYTRPAGGRKLSGPVW